MFSTRALILASLALLPFRKRQRWSLVEVLAPPPRRDRTTLRLCRQQVVPLIKPSMKSSRNVIDRGSARLPRQRSKAPHICDCFPTLVDLGSASIEREKACKRSSYPG